MAQTTAIVPTGPAQDASKPHTSPPKLEDQAALAALYVTKHNTSKDGQRYLDGDHKLSSAGAAASLKYAQPKDLPSYPIAGLKDHDSAAGAAASSGWANQKPFEHWKSDPSASASAAAMLAKDYKMAPLWQPEASANGAKAAVLAHRDGGKVEIWQPEANAWGGSAAAQAFKKYGAGTLSPQLNYGYTALGRRGSLMAATGAMANSRKRAESNPTTIVKVDTYPDESRAASNALSAATSSMKKKRPTGHIEGGSVPYTNMGREMYTSHPPVAPEVEEQNRNNVLRASAVAMAKQMYNDQQTHIDAATDAHHGAVAAHGRHGSISTTGEEATPMRFVNLQEAAQKLAQERLAKLHDEHAQNREYRDYYSSEGAAATSKHSSYAAPSKLTIRGRQRRRASSTGTVDSDQEQSNRIRAQMSMFSSNLSQVDTKKRQHDREALIAAAQRNVTKSLHGMDERVFADTGKIGPSLLSEWEVKAHAAAQAKSDTRMENYGKKNVQPVLDEINEKAEQQRVRQAEIQLEQDTQRRKDAEKKMQEKEKKDINKQLKQKDKEERKGREAEEKAAMDEDKRLSKEKRRSQKADAIPVVATTNPASGEGAEATPASPESVAANPVAAAGPAPIRTSMEDQASLRIRDAAFSANKDEPTPINTSPTSPKDDGYVKNWLKNRFSRRQSRGQKSGSEEPETNNQTSFVGGAALTGASANDSTVSLGQKSAGVTSPLTSPAVKDEEPEDERLGRAVKRKDSDVSELSEAEFQEARDGFDEDLAPPPTFVAGKSSSPARETKFVEAI
ncbi:hypothetical protein LSUB1_G006969 [Lachnellula subtilissima]|uniref:Eisosome protein 1 n=1 Tax=Lachnellula subtilissima TaxID=602034 RepID=A0A8H8RH55_9HELO|nr:hypothetical protein LSUB1_G006969 [Lachnellula subtilissima]